MISRVLEMDGQEVHLGLKLKSFGPVTCFEVSCFDEHLKVRGYRISVQNGGLDYK